MCRLYAGPTASLRGLYALGRTLLCVEQFPFSAEDTPVLDLAYVVGTLLFFALMLGYVRACAALGRRNPGDVATEERAS